MSFEQMIGTTGVASDGQTLYVANNKVITRIDRVNNTTDIPHSFEYIEQLHLSPLYLCGIYAKDVSKEVYGIFLMDLSNHQFTNKELTYDPYIFKTLQLENRFMAFAIDRSFNGFFYDAGLNESEKISFGFTKPFQTVDIVFVEKKVFTVKDKKIDLIQPNPELDAAITGDILATLYQNQKLYIIYKSSYTEYSILCYDLENKKILKTIYGSHTTTPVYACIHQHTIYVSSQTNKTFPLTLFDSQTYAYTYPKPTFSLFDHTTGKIEFIDNALNINTTVLKERKDSLIVDTSPVISSHIYYYVWFFVCIFVLALVVMTFFTSEKRVLNLIILLILAIASFFILRRYI